MSDEELQRRAAEIDLAKTMRKATGTVPTCPWCEKPLGPLETMPRIRMAGVARYGGWGWYIACELCAWDMDGTDTPPILVLH